MNAVPATEIARAARVGADALAAAGVWRLGDARVDFSSLRIEREGTSARLTPKSMCVLLVLVRHAGRTLSRDQIMDQVWPGEYPLPDVLSHAIKELRRALGDPVPHSQLIQTVPRVGYRLLATPEALAPAAEAAVPSALPEEAAAPPVAPQVAAAASAEVMPDPRAATAGHGSVAALRAPGRRARLGVLGLLALATAVGFGAWWPRDDVSVPAMTTPTVAGIPPPRVRLLTSTLRQERQPALAPDAKRFAHVRFLPDSLRSRIVIAAVAGGAGVEIAGAADQDLMPAWSRAGDRLAWQRVRGGRCEILVAPIDGLQAGPPQSYGPCQAEYLDPVEWDAQDRGLWLGRPLEQGSPAQQLAWRDPQGRDHPLVYARAAQDYDSEPKLSPDGRWLAFRRGRPPGGQLLRVSARGGEVQVLTTKPIAFGRFDWLPDARQLLVPVGPGAQRELHLLDTESGDWRALGLRGADQVDVPDSLAQAVFEIERGRPRFELWLHDLATRAPPQRIAESTGSNRDPAFAPSGEGIVLVSDRSGQYRLWWLESANAEPRALVGDDVALLADPTFGADGRQLTSIALHENAGQRVLLRDFGDDRPAREIALPQTRVRAARPHASGIAYVADVGRGWSAFMLDLAETGAQPRALAGLDGLAPMVEADGERLCFLHLGSSEVRCSAPPWTSAEVVRRGVPLLSVTSWRISAGALWYLDLDDDRLRTLLKRVVLHPDASPVTVLDLGELQTAPRIAISADGQRVLVQRSTAAESDIGSALLGPLTALGRQEAH